MSVFCFRWSRKNHGNIISSSGASLNSFFFFSSFFVLLAYGLISPQTNFLFCFPLILGACQIIGVQAKLSGETTAGSTKRGLNHDTARTGW